MLRLRASCSAKMTNRLVKKKPPAATSTGVGAARDRIAPPTTKRAANSSWTIRRSPQMVKQVQSILQSAVLFVAPILSLTSAKHAHTLSLTESRLLHQHRRQIAMCSHTRADKQSHLRAHDTNTCSDASHLSAYDACRGMRDGDQCGKHFT